MICEHCGEEIVECEQCGHQFKSGDYVVCGDDGHFCDNDCLKEYMYDPSAEEYTYISCGECGDSVESCDYCGNCFESDAQIFCGDRGHFCCEDCDRDYQWDNYASFEETEAIDDDEAIITSEDDDDDDETQSKKN
jgi:hypothetical protein